MRKAISIFLFMLIACNATLSAQKTEPISGEECCPKRYTTSWIGNVGGKEQPHIPHYMLNMFVTSEGVAMSGCG